MTAHGSPDRVSLDALLVHREWVRELARRLVADVNAADDVEQETWRMAIEKPPRHAESLRGWLAAVVRNAARGERRRASRRARHEAETPERREVPSPEDIVAAAEMQARLARAVLDLDEPYRSTVLYRFHEGLAAADVAARLGVPVETVRTRLKRAIERLRARMDVDLGEDRDAWCLLLFGRRLDRTAVAGGVAMAAMKKLAVAAVLVAAAWLSWSALWTDAGSGRDGSSSASGVETATAPAAKDAKRRTAGAAASSSATRPALAHGEVEVVVTAAGAPAVGATVEAYRIESDDDAGSSVHRQTVRLSRPSAAASTRTDVEGAARLALGVADAFLVVARQTGFAPEAAQIDAGDLAAGRTVRLGLATAHRLSGRVLDGSRRAVAGATVLAVPTRLRGIGRTARTALSSFSTADASGTFAFDDLPAGRLDLWAARPGGVATCVAVADVPNVGSIELVLTFDGALAGVVTDAATGAPLADATIEVWRDGGTISCAATAATGADGTWTVTGLPLGVVSVRATKSGYLAAMPKDESGLVHLVHGGTKRCDLALRRGVPLTGRVLGPDGPVAGATVSLARASDVSWDRPRTRSGADGTYRFDAVAPGEAFVVVSVDGLVQPGFGGSWGDDVRQHRAPKEAGVVVPESGEARLDVTLSRGLVVAGRVIDADGRAAANAEVSLRFDDCEIDGPVRWQSAKTGDDGTFRFAGVAPAQTPTLSAWHGDLGVADDVRPGLDADRGAPDVELRLGRFRKLVVAVTAPEGLDVRDAVVQGIGGGVSDAEAAERWSSSPTSAVGEDGTVTLNVMPASGGLLVQAAIPGRARSTIASVSFEDAAGEEVRVALVLAPTVRLRGVVTTREGVAVAGAWVSVGSSARPQRMIGISAWGSDSGPRDVADVAAVTDERGRFEIESPEQSDQELHVSASGFTTAHESLTSRAEEVRVELTPSLAIRGHVRFPDGRPATPVRLSIHSAYDGTPTETRTDDDGSFAFADLEDGPWMLSIHPLPVGAAIAPLDVGEVRPRAEPFEFVVDPALVLSGRVVTEDGRPVEDCSVQGYCVGTGPMIDRFAGNHASDSTDEDGRFSFNGMTEGSYVLVVVPPRDAEPPLLAPVRIDGVAAGTVDLRVLVKRGLAAAGRVVDAEGRPVGSVQIAFEAVKRAGPDPDADACWSGRMFTQVDETGGFRMEGLPPGRWKLVLLDGRLGLPSRLQPEGDSIVRAGDTDLRLVASGARSIVGTLVNADGTSVAGDVELCAEGGPTLSYRTDGEGRFAFVDLDATRRYRLVAAAHGRQTAPFVEDDVAPGRIDLRVEFGPGLRAEGRIVGAGGAPLSDVLLRFRSGTRLFERFAKSGGDGTFVVRGLVEGRDYAASVDLEPGPDKADWRDCGTVRAGDVSVELRLR